MAGGTVEHFGDDEIVVRVIGGGRARVRIDQQTSVTIRDRPAALSDLYPGIQVVAFGSAQADGTVLAELLQLSEP